MGINALVSGPPSSFDALVNQAGVKICIIFEDAFQTYGHEALS